MSSAITITLRKIYSTWNPGTIYIVPSMLLGRKIMSKIFFRSLAYILVLVILSSCGLSPEAIQTAIAQIQTANLTNAPAGTKTPAPDHTVMAVSQIYLTATDMAKWTLKLDEPFSSNIFEWCDDATANTRSDGTKSRFYIENGHYHIKYTEGEEPGGLWCAPYGTYYDFQLSIFTKLIDGADGTYYGIIFRAYHQSYSSSVNFLINPDNEYLVRARSNDGGYVILQNWTASYDLKPLGEWNKITISAVGSEFLFSINDVFQTRIVYENDDTEKGSIGVSVGSQISRKSIDVIFDNLIIREP